MFEIVHTSADIYDDIRPGEVRWIELARGEKHVFVNRVEGKGTVYDADGVRIGCACIEALIWTTSFIYDDMTDEEREKMYSYALEYYVRELQECCEKLADK